MKPDSLKQYVKLRRSLTSEKNNLEARLHAINQALDGTLKMIAAAPAKRKRKMSAAGRARIVAAQKARWAKIKASKRG